MMKRSIFAAALLSLGAALISANSAKATLIVSATISSQQVQVTPTAMYKYSFTLTNSASSTDSASSLWFSWFPGYDLLPSVPTNFTAPSGWTGKNAFGPPDFYGIASAQWTTSTASLAPGQTLSGFTFISPDSPQVLAGNSPFGVPIEETYVYSIAPESGSAAALVPTTVVPEPASVSLLLGAPVALLVRRKRQCSR